MSDTVLLGKTIRGSFKSCLLYVFADASLDIGNELQTMTWGDKSPTYILGWALLKLGGIAILVKAYYSKSATHTSVTATI